jgi:hypothetical protein
MGRTQDNAFSEINGGAAADGDHSVALFVAVLNDRILYSLLCRILRRVEELMFAGTAGEILQRLLKNPGLFEPAVGDDQRFLNAKTRANGIEEFKASEAELRGC